MTACSSSAAPASESATPQPAVTALITPTIELTAAATDIETASATEAATATSPSTTPSQPTCTLTPTDMLGPFYTPGAPQRAQVGEGYVLTGVVRSGLDCSPIPGAQIDFWLAGPQGDYGDEWRAVTFSAADGSYRFESHPPPPYSGRPAHIHILVSTPGYQTLVTQHYPSLGSSQATFDLVLSTIP